MPAYLNLTQHPATPEQRMAGVYDLPFEEQARLSELLTFHTPPSQDEMNARADDIAALAQQAGAEFVMLGGAPFFMSTLEAALWDAEIVPRYAFSRRESVERVQDDGSVLKVNVFRHAGFVCPAQP